MADTNFELIIFGDSIKSWKKVNVVLAHDIWLTSSGHQGEEVH